VSRSILSESDRVVGGDPEDLVMGESREADGTGGVRNEVEEGSTEGDNGAEGMETVHDGAHSMLADTIANVTTRVVTEAGGRGLEVDSLLVAGEVGTSKVGRSTDHLGENVRERLDYDLGVLAGSDGGVTGLVDREGLLPTFGELTSNAAGEFGPLLRVLLLVRGEESVPVGVGLSTLLGSGGVDVVRRLGNGEGLLRVEADSLLNLGNVVLLERSAVDTVGALELGTKADRGGELDDSRLVLGLLGLLDGGEDLGEVAERGEELERQDLNKNTGSHVRQQNGMDARVAVLDVDVLPSVSLKALLDVLSEGDIGVTIDGDVVVVVDGDKVAELKVASNRGGL
jgi:hypothetical protein